MKLITGVNEGNNSSRTQRPSQARCVCMCVCVHGEDVMIMHVSVVKATQKRKNLN